MAINFLNTVAVDENVLFVDAVNDRVGIGTDSPDVRLEVVEASPTNGIVADFVNSTNAGGTTAAIKLSNADSEACDVVLGANRVGANFGSDFFISLSDGVDGSNQERFRITEAGNVGIGTSSPGRKLEVDFTGSVYGAKFNRSDAVGSSLIEFANSAGVKSIIGYDAGVGGYKIGTASATNIVVKQSGNVGIGVTSPSFKLDVGGNARFQDSVYIDTSTGSGGLYVTRLGSASESLKIYTSDSTSVFETFQDENTGVYGSMAFVLDNGAPDPDFSFKYGSQVRLKIEGGTGDVILGDALLSSQEDTDIDTGVGIVAKVVYATYTAAFFDFVIKKGTNVRSGTVYACHNGDTTPLVEFTETSTNDLGDTSDVTLSVDISGTHMRLLATVTSDDWSVKSLIRAI